jgi:hypothetical protein
VEAQTRFNYFSDIEEHYQRRRGTLLPMSSLDWVLMETWKDAGIPLEAVLRGMNAAFDRYDARPSKTRKINSLAYCAQEVLAAAEEMQEAGTADAQTSELEPGSSTVAQRSSVAETGFEIERIAAYVRNNAAELRAVIERVPDAARSLISDSVRKLEELAGGLAPSARLEDLERVLTVMEEKIFASLMAATPDEQIVAVRAEADRELAPYRRKMSGPQIEQLKNQYIHKRLLERFSLPRLSLFYM